MKNNNKLIINDEFRLNGGDVNNSLVLNSTDDIRKISKPLSDYMGISYFSFARLYHDTTRIYLNPNSEFVKLYNSVLFKNAQFNKDASFYSVSAQFWSNYGSQKTKLLMKEKFNISDGLVIVWKNKMYTDIYIFALPTDFNEPHPYLLENQRYLQHFCVYFREASKKIIMAANQYDRRFLRTRKSDLRFYNEIKQNANVEKFIQCTTPRFIEISDDEINCTLSHREIICLVSMLKGECAKKIAARLNISYRTVQKHLQNAKDKFNKFSKDELLGIFKQYGLDHLIFKTD